MAVYERTYHGYEGPLTPTWSRFLIVPRYSYREVFQSKLFSAFFTICFVPPIAYALYIYLHHNLGALTLLNIPQGALTPIGDFFWFSFMGVQSWFVFLIALFVGPALVSPDLANNGLALYLCRPFTRREYVLGKMSVLVIMMSLVTWVPGLILFLLQSYLEGGSWMSNHLGSAGSIFIASWMWILVLSLLTLAASAWVKRKLFAGALIVGAFIVSGAMGGAAEGILRTRWGHLVNLGGLVMTVMSRLFGVPPPTNIPLGAAIVSLLVFCAFCLALLARKVKAYEVVR